MLSYTLQLEGDYHEHCVIKNTILHDQVMSTFIYGAPAHIIQGQIMFSFYRSTAQNSVSARVC